ncbi:thiamine pyrophosphate-binding protein [Pikeienuella piscinae]|uniref:Thiamine pyrophosphate-binding protein n=1 Tax=Pikeienuella piscinae TaxID=2748098 RepID=A0A7L5BW83_9RHOB|nr:thiamine pyrophosphate-binding protein [Pikeienuella piscinae]QIE56135.1 thiamine pyrophosphate-binding protein [Pikeienuella piscinae]
MKTGGEILIECLLAEGVERLFCVPGESYLAALDALHGGAIEVINARQEGGAAMMAEADGKLTGRPGVAFVTRGPGATNAASGVHVAKQDSTPMVLFVGQIGRRMKGREAFQEVDYRQTFGDLAKWVEEIDHADRIPEVISHAWHVAMSGRPGPVVLALPEDMLREQAEAAPAPMTRVAEPAPSPREAAHFAALLAEAKRPVLALGGSRWDADAVAAAQRFAERHDLPVTVTFRRQGLFDHEHPNYAGDLGIGPSPKLRALVAESDLLILLGARMSEMPSQGFELLSIPTPQMKLVHIHPGAEELGRIYAPTLAINATPGVFLESMESAPPRGRTGAAEAAHAAYLDWSGQPPATPGDAEMGPVMSHLRSVAPDAVITNGAGNYATWIHRFWRFRRFGAQLAPISGSMGYGLPAAVAAKLRDRDAEVICFAGDGCFQMTGQEFGTLAQYGLGVIVIVVDNSIYGTIRMHQERDYPERISATDLVNPDFAALARAYGGHGETVLKTAEFPDAFARARAAGKPAIIHIKTSAEAITPTVTLSGLRARSR